MLSDLELLQSSERDLRWFNANSDMIREKFVGKIVAIKDGCVVESAGNINELLEVLKKKGIDQSEVLIEAISPANEITIL